MKIKLLLGIVSLFTGFTLAACGSNQEEPNATEGQDTDHSEMNHSDMSHSSSGVIPAGLKEADNPTYPVESKAILKTDHMNGMKDAEATIVGAYNTTAYVISYTPTTGGEKVENHKWIIQEEIKNAGRKTLEPGTEVTIEASHMEGMDGAKGTIESSENTTVYMVDYTPTTGGEEVKNHKWVTESELTSK
ncbi:YdhK family protein [Bacillus sp. Cr_A10]|uniref:YdhK family protein n=1 Tax=Bacillus sp. Cr_A10 TaxID=3033993 RepID=UPI0023DB28F1|nr:YdhK family protein [Bacillus sp. Cr_A10]MDF2068028.1 YdhK family protein [Bacillus sp. Cr_A10]